MPSNALSEIAAVAVPDQLDYNQETVFVLDAGHVLRIPHLHRIVPGQNVTISQGGTTFLSQNNDEPAVFVVGMHGNDGAFVDFERTDVLANSGA